MKTYKTLPPRDQYEAAGVGRKARKGDVCKVDTAERRAKLAAHTARIRAELKRRGIS